jgi:hypothetical protein
MKKVKILEPRQNVREPVTGYFFRMMTVQSYKYSLHLFISDSSVVKMLDKTLSSRNGGTTVEFLEC